MVKEGIPVMVSSHSPYFIQGIRYFAHQEQIEELVKYYLTENDETSDLSTVEDVTTNLNNDFQKTFRTLKHIMNRNDRTIIRSTSIHLVGYRRQLSVNCIIPCKAKHILFSQKPDCNHRL